MNGGFARGLRWLCATTAAAALGVPASASGASVGWNSGPTFSSSDSILFSEGDETSALQPEVNTVALNWDDRNDRRLGFTDRNPIIPGTNELDATLQQCNFLGLEARCKEPRTALGGGFGFVDFRLGGKDDTLRVGASVRVHTYAHGGPGNDRLFAVGSSFGGEGNDVLVGHYGPGHLGVYFGSRNPYGDPEDRPIYGDPGADHFHAQDGYADQVYCGPGHDVVHDADPGDSLIDCEVVRAS